MPCTTGTGCDTQHADLLAACPHRHAALDPGRQQRHTEAQEDLILLSQTLSSPHRHAVSGPRATAAPHRGPGGPHPALADPLFCNVLYE